MLATMNQIVNLLSGFQKQFPLTNNQLRTSSNSRSHATVHDGQIITETVQRRAPGNIGNTGNRGTQNYGQMTDNVGKKVICYNCLGEGHVSRQCKEKKRVKDLRFEIVNRSDGADCTFSIRDLLGVSETVEKIGMFSLRDK
ncbi:integrase, catalytic region, zinc finger, CCHC-type containing protein [Tanacetum coccineum]|uniref:Integrase, catalytic region, zinc finger, CCHC-type containing protein n=1 Tax=Tanacetum coccineum TaxID=301880 RepID=A0ABQ5IKR7_9ASTR